MNQHDEFDGRVERGDDADFTRPRPLPSDDATQLRPSVVNAPSAAPQPAYNELAHDPAYEAETYSQPQWYAPAMRQSAAGGPAYPTSQSSAPGFPTSQSSAPSFPVSQPSAPSFPASQPSAPSFPPAMPMSASQPSAPAYPTSQPSAPWGNSLPPMSQASAYEMTMAPPQKRFPIHWLIVGAVIAALVCAMGYFAISEMNSSVAKPVAPAQLQQRQAPPGWTPTYAWSIATEQASSVVVADNRVAYIDARGALNVLNADTGENLLTSSSQRLSGSARTVLAQVQGSPAVGVVDGTNLYLWPLNAAGATEPKVVTLQPGAKVFSQGGGLMVLAGSSQWAVTAGAQLTPVTIPSGHVALGVTPDGATVSAPTRGGWHFTPADSGQAGRDVRPEKLPEGAVGELQAGRFARGIIAGWADSSDGAKKVIALYNADSGKLLASASVPVDMVKDVTLTVNPTGELASAGPLLARLTDGRTVFVERWFSQMSDARYLYGSRDGAKFVWSGEGDPQPLEPRVVIPWGTSTNGQAIVMEQGENGHFILGALKKS